MKKATLYILLGIIALTAGPWAANSQPNRKAKVDKAALERTRKTVRMLDDIYKQAVVLITGKYVKDENDYPAGRAAKVLFRNISEKGWHTVRLIDVSGKPYNPANVAKDAFEKKGVEELIRGKDYVDEVEIKEGKAYLRAITPIPVVMKKCILCHSNYAQAKKGEAVGALSYTVPIE